MAGFKVHFVKHQNSTLMKRCQKCQQKYHRTLVMNYGIGFVAPLRHTVIIRSFGVRKQWNGTELHSIAKCRGSHASRQRSDN
jgi:hypothetical protein